MTPDERVALHRRQAEGLVDAYRGAAERGVVVYPEELVFHEDMTFWSPTFGKGVDFPWAKALAAAGVTISQSATLEAQWMWSKIPDFGALDGGRIVVNETGWAMWWSMGGTAVDGHFYRLQEIDFITTNADGAVTRWEAFVDKYDLGALLKLLTGNDYPDGISLEEYLGLVEAFHIQRAS